MFKIKNILLIALVLAGESAAFTTPTATKFAKNSMPTELAVSDGEAEAAKVVEPKVDEDATMFDSIAEPIGDITILALRLATCSLMVHHGLDKIQNVDGFSANVVAKFFGFLPGPPSFWTLSAAATQVAGAGLLTVGVLARPVSFAMMCTMITAVVFHIMNTGAEGFPLAVVPQHSYNYELAAMYVSVLAYFSATGAGAYSVDEKILGGELKFYESIVNKVFGKDEKEDAYVNNEKRF
mmetsp:Transcript_42207/g.47973  ORF Transcript_42207/g.47973 Transcript_42207/m.47973 type:complete len:238 (-) Transcript_42207:83-796(-)|eukprot:CAMPEP_0194147048 /NCGR_PEP_ID=MMETSP0152-20130528/22488_1 /TAXON_ID=1049557 /ORGANISM="Thalassiothrix antarctica, Strain L6-D1" /LENGTH=237 /DNA_ID=CAMNT_0038847725 /DNA_START=50 /DNA_END=763 /DNA_ORIENTATION=-